MLGVAPKDSFVPAAQGDLREFTDAEFRQIKATYYGMIAEVDVQVGRAFDAIKGRGEWDDTLVIFTSDHAEMLGDHWLLGKGGFHDESQHIPLVIRDPRRTAARGRQIGRFTESIDIFPTLLDRLGVEPRHHPDGASLLPFLEGAEPRDWRDAAHWEFDFREIASRASETHFGLRSTQLNLAVVRTEKWKYVHFAALPPLLFDLEDDPANLRNLAADRAHATVRLEMAERLLSWRAEHLDQTLALQELTAEGVVRQRT